MKLQGHGVNEIAYTSTISALSKGKQWEKALELFHEIKSSGGEPSVITYNATMTALERGLQWKSALDLFEEMKRKKMAVTIVSYGSAIAACDKGCKWKLCLRYLDEMSELNIQKNVVVFGAAMSCMEKSCRADIAFQLMDKMKSEGIDPNVHIYNSLISACAKCDLWKKGLEVFYEMEQTGVVRDIVTYNAILDSVWSQFKLSREIFRDGIEHGFYSKVYRSESDRLELDLHFLSLGAGEAALGWWFEEGLVPYLGNRKKLLAIKFIDIVTGYGKSRLRAARQDNDGMKNRLKAMLTFMNIHEIEQPNKGRIRVDKKALMQEWDKNGGKIIFDSKGYKKFRINEISKSESNVNEARSNQTESCDTDKNMDSKCNQSETNERNSKHENESHMNKQKRSLKKKDREPIEKDFRGRKRYHFQEHASDGSRKKRRTESSDDEKGDLWKENKNNPVKHNQFQTHDTKQCHTGQSMNTNNRRHRRAPVRINVPTDG